MAWETILWWKNAGFWQMKHQDMVQLLPWLHSGLTLTTDDMGLLFSETSNLSLCVYECTCAHVYVCMSACACVCAVCVYMDMCAVHRNHSVAVTQLLRLRNVTCTLTSELYHALQFVSRK